MYANDNIKHLGRFFENTRKYDAVRNEDTPSVFPELKELFDKYEKN